MRTSIRTRMPLYLQLGIPAGCIACADYYSRAHRHPVGVVEVLLRLAPCGSLLLLVWLACEVIFWDASRWRRIAGLAVGVVSLLLTHGATDLLLVRE